MLRLDGCCLEQKVGYGRDAAPKPREPWSAGRVLLVFRRRGCLMSQILVDIPPFPMMVFRLGLFWAFCRGRGLEWLLRGVGKALLLEGFCSGKARQFWSTGLES